MDSPCVVDFQKNLDQATQCLKVLANRNRLVVMCKIVRQPHTVSELVELTGLSQPALSLHLAKLRNEGMVSTKRQGKQVYYSIACPELEELVEHICYRFQCWGE
jgi:ArsR family transcriptional regulator